MQQAVDRSPKRYDRQQLLAITALENEDWETSREALTKVTREGRAVWGMGGVRRWGLPRIVPWHHRAP